MPGKASASPAYWRYAGERQRSPVFAGFLAVTPQQRRSVSTGCGGPANATKTSVRDARQA